MSVPKVIDTVTSHLLGLGRATRIALGPADRGNVEALAMVSGQFARVQRQKPDNRARSAAARQGGWQKLLVRRGWKLTVTTAVWVWFTVPKTA